VDAVFFATPGELRAWLVANHETAPELIVGYFKKGTGKPSITWPESVDQALCFGWIDGVRRGIDAERYCIRFTPRRAGHLAFAARTEGRSSVYAHEQETEPVLPPEAEARFRANTGAWAYFCAQPPSYRRTVIHLVTSAKKPETRERRLVQLIAHCAEEQPIPQLRWGAKK